VKPRSRPRPDAMRLRPKENCEAEAEADARDVAEVIKTRKPCCRRETARCRCKF